MNPLQSIKTEELSNALYQKGLELAEAEKVFMEFDKNREACLASLADELVQGDGLSHTQAMVKARNTSIYKDYIQEMAEAKKGQVIARAKYASVDAEIRIRLSRDYMSRRELNSGRVDT